MNISIVDTSSVLAGSTAVEAFRTPVELAQLADQAGSSRYWLSELHSVLTNAGATPEVAVAAVASRTSNLRVGSGGVLLNHRSPYRVAETFLQLHAMFLGRIDLGIGRATSGRLIDFALQQTRSAVLPEENYEGQVIELLHWFDGFDDDHPFAKVPFFEGVAGRPEPWILGSSRLLAFFRGEFPDGHPYGRVTAVPGQGAMPPINVLPLEDAALAHHMIDTGHVRGKLVLKVAELSA
jgi:luciferase family oxidoreductase group 1